MLKKRIIPLLLLESGRLVKGRRFGAFRHVGSPSSTAKIYNAQKVDELILLDIEPNKESRAAFLKILNRVAEECFVPLTVGGGINTLEDVGIFLSNGADKVSVNTAAVENPDIVHQIAEKYGKQCVVVSIDYKIADDGERYVHTHSGKNETGLRVDDHLKKIIELGAGEVLLTNIECEGEMEGLDVEYIKKVSSEYNVPIIASGGAGNLNDFLGIFTETEAEAVAAGSIFHFTDQSPIKVRFFLNSQGINVRKV